MEKINKMIADHFLISEKCISEFQALIANRKKVQVSDFDKKLSDLLQLIKTMKTKLEEFKLQGKGNSSLINEELSLVLNKLELGLNELNINH